MRLPKSFRHPLLPVITRLFLLHLATTLLPVPPLHASCNLIAQEPLVAWNCNGKSSSQSRCASSTRLIYAKQDTEALSSPYQASQSSDQIVPLFYQL
ncbi:hypothetical protein ACCO45_001744 [Purpureocillium lilacinum]|uniref:Uncharacterized protein n=1 Tax=Purpureocillium lilacinum TaxID=33203 RepID=A0ACC4E7W4_PURLI